MGGRRNFLERKEKEVVFKIIGAKGRPAMGLRLRFGRVVEAKGPGLYWYWWPTESWVLFPTGQYELEFSVLDIVSKEVKQGEEVVLGSQRMDVDLTVYFRWPGVTREYLFPQFEPNGKVTWVGTKGAELLAKAYYALPFNPGKVTFEDYERFFDSAVLRALTDVLSNMDHTEIRTTRRREVEPLVKSRLLDEPGDTFFEIGLPAECFDVAIRRIKFEDGIVVALSAAEIAQRQARAAVETAKGQKEAAVFQAAAARELLGAYISLGVPADVAGFLASGRLRPEEGMSIAEFRDLAIAMTMRGGAATQRSSATLQWLEGLTPQELNKLAVVKEKSQS